MSEILKEDLIKYRIERANETLLAAEHLAEKEFWNEVASRLYYCCFYIAIAALLKKELNAKSHSGIKTLFYSNYIKGNPELKKYAILYNMLFDKRLDGDYSDFKKFTKEEIEPLIFQVKEFINFFNNIISSE
jgi:uncharacterized protein (UPF0332 family)